GLWLSGQGMRLHNLGPLEGEKPGEPQDGHGSRLTLIKLMSKPFSNVRFLAIYKCPALRLGWLPLFPRFERYAVSKDGV
ncbi:hypothetical protein, partial [Burkholderia ubonensis]|uniref:hypothetical protein n=1 Tax=Burkholderia ubonensis TaxID=101571 RepID=UPI001E46967F